MKYEDIRDNVETGDIFLFSGSGFISRAIQIASGSKWSHVGVAIELPGYDWKLLLESTTLSNIPSLAEDPPTAVKGVQVVPLSQRIRTYDGDVGFRKISGMRTENQLKCAIDFQRRYSGTPYEENKLELVKAAMDLGLLFEQNQPDTSSLFCSELVAMLLVDMEIARWSNTPANEHTPADFATDLPLHDGFEWGGLHELEK